MPVRPPVEKLPLAARKNIRDEWESKKPEFESTISDLLGAPWTITVDQNQLFAYVSESDKSNPGTIITNYLTTAVEKLKSEFLSKYNQAGKDELNNIVSSHTLTITPDETGTVGYNQCRIKDDQLQIVFNENYYGSYVSDGLGNLNTALDAASAKVTSADELTFLPRVSVQQQYDTEIESVAKRIQDILKSPNLPKLNTNFAANAQALEKGKASDWKEDFGAATLKVFKDFADTLVEMKFDSDDMLQEGFQEGVDKMEVSLKVVDKLRKGSWNEIFLEDGVLFLQYEPGYWGTSIKSSVGGLIDLL